MGRRKKKEEPKGEAGAPLWMVTYSDMVTLLMCFFVMQLAFANFQDPGKVDAVMKSLEARFGTGGVHQQTETPQTPQNNTDMPESQAQSTEQLMSALQSVLAEMMSQNFVRMTQTQTEIRITIDEMLLFRPGSSEVNPGSLAVITDIAETIGNVPVTILVRGYADADGTSEEQNWRMSAMRAVSVVSELRRVKNTKGSPFLDGRYIEAHGMGEFHPADIEKDTSKWNRRVELVIRGRDSSAQSAIKELQKRLGERNGR